MIKGSIVIAQSIIIGIIFGFLWGKHFAQRYNHVQNNRITPKTSAQFLAGTSLIRYILLASFLGLLVAKNYVNITWWFVGFLAIFWLTLITSLKRTIRTQGCKVKK